MAQSPSAVILEPPKIKSDTVSTVSPSISHEVMGPDAMIFIFWMLSFKPNFSAGKTQQNNFVVVIQLLSPLQLQGLWLARHPCPLPSPGVCSNLRPLSRWCYPTISSSVVPFSSFPQSFPVSGSFPMSQLFTGGFNFSISSSNEYSGLISFRIDWFDLFCCPRDSQKSSPAPQFFSQSVSIWPCLLASSNLIISCTLCVSAGCQTCPALWN